MGARNRDASGAAGSFIVTHIVAATAPLLIVRAATKRRYRRCCPLLCHCCCHRDDARCRCNDALGLPWCRSTRSCVETWVVKPTGNSARCCHRDDQARKEASQEPAHSVLAYLADHHTASGARLPIFKAYRLKSFKMAWIARSVDMQGTAPRIA